MVREDGHQTCHVVHARVPTDEARIELAESWAQYRNLEIAPGDTVFCEQPLSLSNGKTSRILAMAAGCIYLATYWPDPLEAIREGGIDWEWVDVESWKLHVIGKGGVDKGQIQAAIAGRYDVAYDAEDYYDARAILEFGRLETMAGWRLLSKKEEAKLKKSKPDDHKQYIADILNAKVELRLPCVLV